MSLLSRGRSLVTLTIERGAVKLLTAGDHRVLDYRLQPVNPAFFREGFVSRPSRVAQTVKESLRSLGVARPRVTATVPGYGATLGVVTLPDARGMDPRVVLPREAALRFGITPEGSILRWHRLPGQGQARWLVVAAGRRSVDALRDTAAQAGLQLAAVELRPFALARAVNKTDAIIAWQGPDGADTVVVRDAVPVAYQSLFYGAEAPDEEGLIERMSAMIESVLAGANAANTEEWVTEDAALYVLGMPPELAAVVGRGIATNLGRELGETHVPIDLPEEFPVQELIANIGLALGRA